MADIGHHERPVGSHKIVVFEVRSDIHIGLRTTRFAEQRGSRSGTYGHPPYLLLDQLGMADYLHRQALLNTPHKIPHRHRLRQFAHHPEANPPVRRIGRCSTRNSSTPSISANRQLMPPGALSRLV